MRYNEIGTTGLNRWGNSIYDEFLQQLRWPQAAKIYKEMADNDPTIGGILYMMQNLVRTVSWIVEPASDSKADIEAAKFLRSCIDDMDFTWIETINEILSFFIYGWSFHEIVYKKRDDGRIGWKKLAPRAQETLYGWEISDDGEILAMIQQAPPLYKIQKIPTSKALLFRTGVRNNNPEGKSLLRNAYRPWYFKKRIEEVEGIGIERDLAGLPVIQPPDGLDLWDEKNPDAIKMKNYAINLVKNVRRDSSEGLVVPFGWDFKLLSTGGSRQFDTNSIINRYDQRIAITMLADIVMLGTDRNGSFALADIKKSILSNSVESLVKDIADVINETAVYYLFRYNNFPNITELPKLVPSQIESPSLKELGDFIRATGINTLNDPAVMDYLKDIVNIPKSDVNDTRLNGNDTKAGATDYNAAYLGR